MSFTSAPATAFLAPILPSFLHSSPTSPAQRKRPLLHSPRATASSSHSSTAPSPSAPSPPRARAGHNPSALLTLGLPKGSLLDGTLELLARAGLGVRVAPRSYYARCNDDDLNLVLFRSQEMARYVALGSVDVGIAGRDWIVEATADMGPGAVVDVGGINYSKGGDGSVKWVLCVEEGSKVRCAEDLRGGVVSTELLGVTEKFFKDRGVENVTCEFSWGATEVKSRAGLVDAICDVTETGDSIRANGLRIVETVMVSDTRVIANPVAWADPARRAKIEEVMLLMDGALQGRKRVGVKMNVPVGQVAAVTDALKKYAVTSPTVANLADERFVSMEIITEAKEERLVIIMLKRLGCIGIFSYNLNMFVE